MNPICRTGARRAGSARAGGSARCPTATVRVATCNALHAVAEHVARAGAPARHRQDRSAVHRRRLRDPVLRIQRAGARRGRRPGGRARRSRRPRADHDDRRGRTVRRHRARCPGRSLRAGDDGRARRRARRRSGRGAIPRRLVRLLVLGARRDARRRPGRRHADPALARALRPQHRRRRRGRPAPGAPSDRRPATPPTPSPTCM